MRNNLPFAGAEQIFDAMGGERGEIFAEAREALAFCRRAWWVPLTNPRGVTQR